MTMIVRSTCSNYCLIYIMDCHCFPYHANSSEIEFKLKFGCIPPTFIDQGVRLEVRLLESSSSTNSIWFPVRYYTPSLVMPSVYRSLVDLNSSKSSVVAASLRYNSLFPLLLINTSESIHITEYFCGQKFREYLQLELRWMQRFGSSAEYNYSTWMLDDINIRIWNGTCFLQLLSQDFSSRDLMSYDLLLGEVKAPSCGTLGSGNVLHFIGSNSGSPTRRSINFKITPNYISRSCHVIDGKWYM